MSMDDLAGVPFCGIMLPDLRIPPTFIPPSEMRLAGLLMKRLGS